MNNIEIAATAAVERSLACTDRLKPYINKRDSGPTWDGFIQVHPENYNTKEGIKRVPVQVKGRTSNDFTKDEISFSVKKVDLENYLQEGGIIYFVVYISKDREKTKIYFASLLPVKIQQLLKNCGRSKSIKFEQFPDDNANKVDIFLNFLENRERQASFVNKTILSLEDYRESNALESILLSKIKTNYEKKDPFEVFFDDEIFLYANLKGSNLPHPICETSVDLELLKTVESAITINSIKYYDNYTRAYTIDATIMKLGQCIQLIEPKSEPENRQLHFSPVATFCDVLYDLDFTLQMLKNKQIELEGSPYPVDLSHDTSFQSVVEKMTKELDMLKEMDTLFGMLGLNKNIFLSNLTDQDRSHIDFLAKTMLLGELATDLEEGLTPVITMDIGNEEVVLLFTPTEKPGSYIVSDFFKTHGSFVFEVEGERQEIPNYAFMTKERFLRVANIDYSRVLQSFKEIGGNPSLYSSANRMILDLLLAYDETLETRKEMIKLAKELAEWLRPLEIEETILPKLIRELNILQIIKRERLLSEDEKKFLYSIIEAPGHSEDIKVAVNLLLDNQVGAEIHFERMSPDEQQAFKDYPIFRFWKKNEEE